MVQELLSSARSLRHALGGFDPALLSGDDCVAVVEALAATEKACGAARARAALRAGDCGTHRRHGFHHADEWLARAAGSSGAEARAALETAAGLERSPATKSALVAGELSLAQAGVIARTEQVAPGSEAELLELARRSGLAGLKDAARSRRLAAMPAAELHARQYKAREFRHWRDELGMVCWRGAAPPEVGVALMTASTPSVTAWSAPPAPPATTSPGRLTPPTPWSRCWRARPKPRPPGPTWWWCATCRPTAGATRMPAR